MTLPSANGRPLASPALAGGEPWPDQPELRIWRLGAVTFSALEAAQLLLALAASSEPLEGARDPHLGDDLHFWISATRCTLDLLNRQRFLPTSQLEEKKSVARWQPLREETADQARLTALAEAIPPVARAQSWHPGVALPGPRQVVDSYVASLVDGVARSVPRPTSPAADGSARTTARGAAVTRAWWAALFGSAQVEGPAAQVRVFREQLQAWTERGREHLAETFRVCFRLEPPGWQLPGAGGAGAEDGYPVRPSNGATQRRGAGRSSGRGTAPRWTLRYLLQATDDQSLLVPVGEVWQERGTTGRFLNRRLEQPQERLLAGLGRAARIFPAVEASLRQARPESCPLTTEEAHQFIREAAVVLRAAGFGVLVPGTDAQLRLRLRLRGGSQTPSPRSAVSLLNREALVAFDWEVALGDQTLSREEFEALAQLKEPLVQIRGQWVELDPTRIAQTLAALEKSAAAELTLAEALQLALAPDADGKASSLPVDSVQVEGWLETLLDELNGGGQRPTVEEPDGFTGQLRPYQKTGVAWLAALERYGLGGCLADDMGLGKTIQVIALLLYDRQRRQNQTERAPAGLAASLKAGALPPETGDATERAGAPTGESKAARVPVGVPATEASDAAVGVGNLLTETGATTIVAGGPTLLVCPTSVAGNWQRELARFAPSLRVLVHHGADRAKEAFAAEVTDYDVVISTYPLLHRDQSELTSVAWDRVVLDEAQNIKNASTRAAQAARQLPALHRLALTGTPVENRLTELWSIFQFLNPGYLDSQESFRRRFATPIERAGDAVAKAQLKKLVAPFIMRRLKTDRSIIQDLPDKQEMKVFCALTREQATLYEAVVRDSLREVEGADGIRRRGQILAALTRLKQICDHPALFLHDRSALEGRSGKLTRLGEMLEEVLSIGDRALIFTQYAEMGRLLKAHLEALFGEEALFLHGGTPLAERNNLVERFQREGRHGPRLFILSVKAGGTGLNLTRANHVFHFDRWWNPAVENQATDRAFRIGQTKNVQVHKYVCAGTFEEVLDQIIERKLALAEVIGGTGESWITEMSTDALRDLFRLRRSEADLIAV